MNAELAALRARRPRPGHYTLRARTGPRVFSQINDPVAIHLADEIAKLIPPGQAPPDRRLLWERLFRPAFVRQIFPGRGIDWDRHAIAAAERKATPAETYLAGDLEGLLRAQLVQTKLSLTTVIVDPPATGLSDGVREILRAHRAATLFYVSCNPPTLARDLAESRKTPTTSRASPLRHVSADGRD